MIKVGIIGASGYTGAELVRLLKQHPEVKIEFLTSENYAGQNMSELYPSLEKNQDLILQSRAEIEIYNQKVALVFLAVPHGEAMKLVPDLIKTGIKIIDLSGDFRFHDHKIYQQWYKKEHLAKEILAKAVYGMPELFRDNLIDCQLIANPGCFVTATVLGLYPLLEKLEVESVVIDAKTGITGAGRRPTLATMYNRISENIIPYKVGGEHQHIPEIEQTLNLATNKSAKITFIPHLIPAKRGILATMYIKPKSEVGLSEIIRLYQNKYTHEPFIKLCDQTEAWPELASVVGTNNCSIKITLDKNSGMLIVVSAIDNLIKGAAGQAVQNFNVLYGLEETLGLSQLGGLVS